MPEVTAQHHCLWPVVTCVQQRVREAIERRISINEQAVLQLVSCHKFNLTFRALSVVRLHI
jgi:hypothetical protein